MRTITDLSQEEQRVLSDLRREIARRLPDLPLRMAVFGSRAMGDAEPESDMDVLLAVETDRVAPSDKQRLPDIASEIALASGIIVSLLVVDQHILKEGGDFPLFDSTRDEGIPG